MSRRFATGALVHRSSPRLGFTLFEIAISLALVCFGVVSVMIVLPQGLKAQQNARYQIHAAVIMQDLTRRMVSPVQLLESVQVETEKLSNNLYLDRAAVSLENVAVGSNLGLAPLPIEICKRIDSDNDEIRRIVDGGGYLYYNLPVSHAIAGSGNTLAKENTAASGRAPGTVPQALIMGFVGLAQQNALPNHPCVSWPYWDQHPCAPTPWELNYWQLNPTWPGQSQFQTLYYGGMNSGGTPAAATITTAKWTSYLLKAQDLVTAVVAEPGSGLSTQSTAGGLVLNPPTPLPSSGWDTRSAAEQRNIYPRPYVVWAASHLAHAASLATGTLADRAGPPTAIQLQYARDTFESCRQWVMRLRDDPYDWAVARQTAQQTAWDFPLIEHDLFSSGGLPAYTDPASGDRAWRVVTARPVTYYGQAAGKYGNGWIPANKTNIDAGWGDPTHFTLTRRFDPSERMRQVVFWSVDWQSYEDFETLSAPPHDASMGFMDSNGTQVSSDWWGITLPERNFYWVDQSRTQTPFQVRPPTSWNLPGSFGSYSSATYWGNQAGFDPFCDTSLYKAGFFMGIYGADRNGNGKLDRGPLPASAHVRATLVARFTVYDRLLIGDLRE